jgi:hypothetical protein
MAITKIQVPKIPSHTFVPMYFQSSSSNVAQPNFRFVYDTFTTTTGATPNSRNRLYPNPNNFLSEYSPSRIFESYVYFEAYPTLTGSTGSTGSYMHYNVAIGEEYGSLITGTTTFSALTTFTGVCINGTLQYGELPNWDADFKKYIMTANTSEFLTNSMIDNVNSLFQIRGTRAYSSDWFTLSFFNDIRLSPTLRPFAYDVFVNDNSGGTSVHRIKLPSASGATATWMQHIGAGPMNLNNTSASAFIFGGAQPLIDSSRDLLYAVKLVNNPSSPLDASELFYFHIADPDCSRYVMRRFIFQNRRGQAEHMTFSLVSKRSVNAERDFYERTLDFNYRVGQRGKSVTDIRAQETLRVTTDWITESENIQVEEFLTSPEIYLLDDDCRLIPYVVNTSSVLFKTQDVDKMINYEFEVQPAHSINTQRTGNQATTASGGNAGGGGGTPIGTGPDPVD